MDESNDNITSELPVCDHKFIFLRKSDMYETSYRKWAHDDVYFCENCLEYRTIVVNHEPRPTYNW